MKVSKRTKIGICVIVSVYLLVSITATLLGKPGDTTATNSKVDGSQACLLSASKLLEYINTERAKLGVTTLTTDSVLVSASKLKADDMESKKYFSHKFPDGNKWDKHVRELGVKASIAENIGSNDHTPENSWEEFKESDEHYKSIIDPQYTRIGIATKCTDYTQEIAIEPGDQQYTGEKITDLTVITLAAPEPSN